MIDRLPLKLTEGVTATLEGLVFDGSVGWLVESVSPNRYTLGERLGEIVIPWPEVAKRLRYREGEPWCSLLWTGFYRVIYCGTGEEMVENRIRLNRLATILCNGAYAFRVLHWCVINLGGSDAHTA